MPSPEMLRWYYFIPRSGPAGRRWLEEYHCPESLGLGQKMDDALNLMRSQRIPEGFRELQDCRDEIDRLARRWSPPVTTVFNRWYLSTLAYYLYLIREYEAAEEALAQTVAAIESAIREAPFLVVLASACCELRLHMARIARNSRHWDEMKRHIELGQLMVRDEYPLCRVAGKDVKFVDVDSFHQSIEPENDEERHALAQLLDKDSRQKGYTAAIRSVGVLPNVVVPF